MLHSIECFLKIDDANKHRLLEFLAFLQQYVHAEQRLSHPHPSAKAKLGSAHEPLISSVNPILYYS